MNNYNANKEISVDIPTQIFENFLEELKAVEVPTEIVERLKSVILKKEIPNEADIKNALFSDILNI